MSRPRIPVPAPEPWVVADTSARVSSLAALCRHLAEHPSPRPVRVRPRGIR